MLLAHYLKSCQCNLSYECRKIFFLTVISSATLSILLFFFQLNIVKPVPVLGSLLPKLNLKNLVISKFLNNLLLLRSRRNMAGYPYGGWGTSGFSPYSGAVSSYQAPLLNSAVGNTQLKK